MKPAPSFQCDYFKAQILLKQNHVGLKVDPTTCTMLSLSTLSNVTSYVPPTPIEPSFPDFALYHSAYGAGLKRQDGLYTGGILPHGTNAITYTVNQHEGGRASQYELPFTVSYAGAKIAVQVAGPVSIESIVLRPNDVRGMAGYLANFCVGRFGTGGFVTKRIQGLVDHITNPLSDLGAPKYPDSTAFITVTMSSPDIRTTAGNYDPGMALFFQRVEENALGRIPQPLILEQIEIADRVVRYAVQAKRMQRLGKLAWWDESPLQGGTTEISDRVTKEQLSNVTAAESGTSRRTKRSRGHLRGLNTRKTSDSLMPARSVRCFRCR